MRILIRTSGWAVWAQRLGTFALPLVIVPVLLHRAGAIDTNAFEATEIAGIVIALLALLASLGAFVRIWITGDRGWGRAVAGFLCSLVCLAPVALLAVDYAVYPMADEVTTDAADPPPLVSGVTPIPASPAAAARLTAAFPNVRPRNYPIPADRAFAIVARMVDERGWEVLRQLPPTDAGGAGQINALATTLFGFRDEVSIRLAPTDSGTTVAMRSTSLTALHEPGVNGSRIEGFLTALDDKITELRKDQPAGTADAADDADQPPVPAPAPPPRGKRR
jgi:hypothetical protein